MRQDISKQDVLDAVKNHPLSMRRAAQSLNIHYRTFIERAKTYGVYDPNQGGLGVAKRPYNAVPLEDVFKGLYPTYDIARLKRRLVDEGHMEYRCVECNNQGIWQSKQLTLQLNHINGNRHDHSLNNLEFLCPNCHCQTDTWGSKNKMKKQVSDEDITKALLQEPRINQAISNLGLSKSSTTYARFKDMRLLMKRSTNSAP